MVTEQQGAGLFHIKAAFVSILYILPDHERHIHIPAFQLGQFGYPMPQSGTLTYLGVEDKSVVHTNN